MATELGDNQPFRGPPTGAVLDLSSLKTLALAQRLDNFQEALDDEETRTNVRPDHILLDHMGFGMGLCCLQVTFQATNMDEARWLYDQLTPLTPIFLALSAATPMYRGYLSDLDCRWDVAAEVSASR